MPNLSKLSALSSLAGFKNYNSKSASTTIPSQAIAPDGFIVTTISIPLNNSNTITTAKIGYSVEGFMRQSTGTTQTGILGAPGSEYSITSITYYSGGNFNVNIYVVDQTGGLGVTIPTIVATVVARLYIAPF